MNNEKLNRVYLFVLALLCNCDFLLYAFSFSIPKHKTRLDAAGSHI